MNAVAYAALWLFVFTMPWDWMAAVPGVAILPRVTGVVAVAFTGVAVVMSGHLRRWHGLHVAALLFWVWAGLALFLFHFGQRLPYKFGTFGQLILVLWIIWEVAPSERRIRGLMAAYVLGAYVAAFETIRLYRREAKVLERFAAGGADGNDLAMMLALALPMAWYLGMAHHRPIMRWVCRFYVPVGVFTVGLTGSRGGMLATTVALLVVPLSMTRLSPKRLITAMIVLGAAGGMAIVYTPETLIERLATTRVEVEGGRFGGRGKLWRAGLAVFPENPVFGVGTGGYKTAITPRLGPAAQVAHNSYVSVLVEQGFVGFFLYMSMFGAAFLSILRLPVLERRVALVLLGTVGIAMLPLTWEDRRAVWFVLAVLVGLSQARIAGRVPARGAARRPMPGPRYPSAVGRARDRLTVPRRDDPEDAPA
jgi:O-antigen ligase